MAECFARREIAEGRAAFARELSTMNGARRSAWLERDEARERYTFDAAAVAALEAAVQDACRDARARSALIL